jgi:hypothetical protein
MPAHREHDERDPDRPRPLRNVDGQPGQHEREDQGERRYAPDARVLRELHARGEPQQPQRLDPDGAESGEATAEKVSRRDADDRRRDRQQGEPDRHWPTSRAVTVDWLTYGQPTRPADAGAGIPANSGPRGQRP